ncbi:adenosylcobinamide-phosphate synthase CbiB [Ferrimonas sp. SCSIO 43195]|uniref:adenosylcobinamide-phosphate synthase CbiB n=1 Tax=Ferrimonas sp. SCSIO 43195 TaxID=2822844 RepID=UPI002074E126|nr:adenosylcobinamide-phosphate synthase CbiB [Ferrimonas sp. SCSIO 43195]
MLMAADCWQVALVVCLALLLDRLLGEPTRFHPLIGLGRLITLAEQKLYGDRRWRGAVALAVLTLPALLLMALPWPWWVEAVVLYLCLGGRSLGEHGQAVAVALKQRDLSLARERVGYIVSRKTQSLTEAQVVSATVESMLENGNDAVFGTLFWYMVAGAPGAIIYRIANTLDARWGYKNAKYRQFGWAAARWDDLLNYLPARLCVMTYAIQGAGQGRLATALRCAWQQGRQCASPNGGPVMASGAGALGVTIGGSAEYEGYQCDKPLLGQGPQADWRAIDPAVALVNRGAVLWAGALILLAVAVEGAL